MASYSAASDLLVGDALTAGLDVTRYLSDATDEIDAALGGLYVTPFDLGDSSDIQRHSRLLLKRINNYIATGRLLMAQAQGDTDVHAYGASLLKEALGWLKFIVEGNVTLDGAERVESDTANTARGGAILNVDASSGVEAFYGSTMRNSGYLGEVVPHVPTSGRPVYTVENGRPTWEPGSP